MAYPTYEDVQKVRQQLSDLSYQHWIHDDLFTWRWWLILSLGMVPWFIWWKLVDKKRVHEILLYGSLIGIMAIILDNIGSDLLWWGYPNKLFQMFP